MRGFAQKAGTGTWIEPVLGTDCLERDPPLEALVEADVNLSHPAAADVTDDADVTDRGADEAHLIPLCRGVYSIPAFPARGAA
jgi:hypothetical protein